MVQAQHTIVIAESARIELEIENTFLRRRGFKVLSAADGASALSLVQTGRPSVLILAQKMPGLSGADVCQRLKGQQDTCKIPVVILLSSEDQNGHLACQTSGADLLFETTHGREDLLQAVARLLGIPARKSARIPVSFMVVVRFDDRETIGKAADLSEGGIYVELNRRHGDGASALLRFILSEGRREIQARARVCWTREKSAGAFATGMEFIEMAPEDRRDLTAYIDGRLLGM